MIHQVETSEAQGARQAKANETGGAKPAGESFASVLASQREWHAKTHHTKAGDARIKVPDGEIWRPVRGDDNYAHIVSGPRKGWLINLSHGARRGQLFHVRYHHGVRVHVYESGKVVPSHHDSGKIWGHRRPLRPGESLHTAFRGHGELWAPVPGHSGYVDILSGSRNGYYVNTSGNARDGMVFHIVHRHGREYRVYGHGEDRQVVLVRHHHDHKPAKAAGPDKPEKADGPDKPDKARDAGTGGASPG